MFITTKPQKTVSSLRCPLFRSGSLKSGRAMPILGFRIIQTGVALLYARLTVMWYILILKKNSRFWTASVHSAWVSSSMPLLYLTPPKPLGQFFCSAWAWLQLVNKNYLSWLTKISTGLHTPGCQTSLVAVAPAYSGAITGFAFFFVAVSGIFNPLITTWIVRVNLEINQKPTHTNLTIQNQTATEWNLVFYISAVIAIAPCVFFSVWGSSDIEPWAQSPKLSNASNKSTQEKDRPEQIA